MIILMILLFLGSIILYMIDIIGDFSESGSKLPASIMCFVFSIVILICGCLGGFIEYKPTNGIHQGTITAVDLEGLYFRRYEIYLKSGGYIQNKNGISEETKYCVYEYENELIEILKDSIGKNVKVSYGHDGGKIGLKSCGTYHIKSIEIIEEVNENTNN